MLQKDLLPHQRKDDKYRIKYSHSGDVQLTTKQRSWIDMMLRKHLGDKKIAFYIWHHGLPRLFDAPICPHDFTKELLQSLLEETMQWHASLLRSLVEHEKRPELEQRQNLSMAEKLAWVKPRKSALEEGTKLKKQGQRLAEQRDAKKRKYEDMSATEQQILEDYDCGRAENDRRTLTIKPDPPFRGTLRRKSSGSATEQA